MKIKTILLIGFVIALAYTIGLIIQASQLSRELLEREMEESRRLSEELGTTVYVDMGGASMVLFPQIVLGVCMWLALLALTFGKVFKKIPAAVEPASSLKEFGNTVNTGVFLGSFTISPRIMYVDENGNTKSHQPEPLTITVKELGIKGWIAGDT